MRLSYAIRGALIALTITAAALATAAYADSGSIRFNVVKAGFVVGGSAGGGTLLFHGRRYPLSIGGISYGFTFGAQQPILSAPSATSEGRPMLLASMARLAWVLRSAGARAGSC